MDDIDRRREAVVDACVVVAWLMEEPLSETAVRLDVERRGSGRSLLAPTLLADEVTNAIDRRRRRRPMSEQRTGAAVARFGALDARVVTSRRQSQRAAAFAKRHRLGATYDSLSVVLAGELGSGRWTNDECPLNTI